MEEDEIKLGEYVRTKNGKIGKIISIEESSYNPNKSYKLRSKYRYCIDSVKNSNSYEDSWSGSFILKHSFKPIDLVEPGDYVNGEEVVRVYKITDDITIVDVDRVTYRNDEIKTIITKEQIEKDTYEIKKGE